MESTLSSGDPEFYRRTPVFGLVSILGMKV